MVDLHVLEDQLKRAGCNFRFWGRAELRELQRVLMPGEQIQTGVNGRYNGGFAFLCVTDRRLLLIDRKPMYLALEDVRFDMIAEVDYSYRLFDATVRVFTPNKCLSFTSWSQHKLRELVSFAQQKVMEIRQYYLGQQFEQQPELRPARTTANGFRPSLAVTASDATVQQAGRLSLGSSLRPMHNPYAQVPYVSRHFAGRRRFTR